MTWVGWSGEAGLATVGASAMSGGYHLPSAACHQPGPPDCSDIAGSLHLPSSAAGYGYQDKLGPVAELPGRNGQWAAASAGTKRAASMVPRPLARS